MKITFIGTDKVMGTKTYVFNYNILLMLSKETTEKFDQSLFVSSRSVLQSGAAR
jgi:hypothetical protein